MSCSNLCNLAKVVSKAGVSFPTFCNFITKGVPLHIHIYQVRGSSFEGLRAQAIEILLVGDRHVLCIFGGVASNQSLESVHLDRELRPCERHYTCVSVIEADCQNRKYIKLGAEGPSLIFKNTPKRSKGGFEIESQR